MIRQKNGFNNLGIKYSMSKSHMKSFIDFVKGDWTLVVVNYYLGQYRLEYCYNQQLIYVLKSHQVHLYSNVCMYAMVWCDLCQCEQLEGMISHCTNSFGTFPVDE